MTISLTENQTLVTTVEATDADGDSLTFSSTGLETDDGNFTIDPSTGALTFNNAPNFESASDSNTDNDYVVGISVTDGTTPVTQIITVRVTDANEAPVIDQGNSLAIPISEDGSPIGWLGTALTASDPDAGDTAILIWSVSSAPSDGTADYSVFLG